MNYLLYDITNYDITALRLAEILLYQHRQDRQPENKLLIVMEDWEDHHRFLEKMAVSIVRNKTELYYNYYENKLG